jgi:hypothetical protein
MPASLRRSLLTSMFTLSKLIEARLATAWELPIDELPQRTCYTTGRWKQDMDALGTAARRTGVGRYPVSPAEEVAGLLDDFVRGTPRARLVRPIGSGMEPPFVRMRPPHTRVIEARTPRTRCFGLFHKANVLVLHRVLHTGSLKQDRRSVAEAYAAAAASVEDSILARLLPHECDGTTDIDELVTD